MYSTMVNHPANQFVKPLERHTYDAMFEVFEQICLFWGNLADPQSYRSRLETFMDNRIRLRPEYADVYRLAATLLKEMAEGLGKAAAYERLFTDTEANQGATETPLSVVRQRVSNEFIAFQVSQGGFKVFSHAINYPSFIAGAYVPGEPPPYRAAQVEKGQP